MSTSPHALPPSWINILTYISAAGDHSSGLRLFETDCLLVCRPRAVCHFLRGATAGGVSLGYSDFPELHCRDRGCSPVVRAAVRHSVGGAVRGSDRPAGRGVLKPSQQP